MVVQSSTTNHTATLSQQTEVVSPVHCAPRRHGGGGGGDGDGLELFASYWSTSRNAPKFMTWGMGWLGWVPNSLYNKNLDSRCTRAKPATIEDPNLNKNKFNMNRIVFNDNSTRACACWVRFFLLACLLCSVLIPQEAKAWILGLDLIDFDSDLSCQR